MLSAQRFRQADILMLIVSAAQAATRSFLPTATTPATAYRQLIYVCFDCFLQLTNRQTADQATAVANARLHSLN